MNLRRRAERLATLARMRDVLAPPDGGALLNELNNLAQRIEHDVSDDYDDAEIAARFDALLEAFAEWQRARPTPRPPRKAPR